MSSSSTNGLAKAKATSKATSINIAALAARNLGGFVPNKIFVGGVPIQSTEEQFKAYFERFGGTTRVELHALRGFGYITYESIESVDSCLEKYEEHYLCKKWVEVKRSIPRELIESYEREQKRLEAEFKADGDITIQESPSVKVETPSNSTSSAPTWGMPPAGRPVMGLPGPRGGASPKAPQAPAGQNSQIQQLMEMGFSEAVVRKVFGECAWDFNKALDRLLTTMGDPEPEEAESPAVPSMADDPPLSAAVAPAAAVGSPPPRAAQGASSPQGAKEPPPAWGKPAPAAGWAKPPDSVWGAPKAAGTAWGKQASPPPTAKAPVGTPKAASMTSPKAGFGMPKSAAEAMSLPPAASPPPPPGSAAAPVGGGYDAASAPEAGGDAVAQPVAKEVAPVTPPKKATQSSVPPPPAVLPPSAATASPAGAVVSPGPASGQPLQSSSGTPKSKPEEKIEPKSRPNPADRILKNLQSIPSESLQQAAAQVNRTIVGEDSAAKTPPLQSQPDVLGAQEVSAAAQEPAAAAIVADLVADDGEEASPEPATAASESKGGLLDATDACADGAPVGTPPRKRIQRMKRDWVAEDPSQLSANEGDFVEVWIETGTDHGWIHAERIVGITDGSTQVGWLPLCVLVDQLKDRRWMRTKQQWQAMGESQCNVEAQKLVVVWVDSRTEQGWTYVEASDDATSTPGWIPDFCIEWNDE